MEDDSDVANSSGMLVIVESELMIIQDSFIHNERRTIRFFMYGVN